jgi:restriction endonuclease Mrr
MIDANLGVSVSRAYEVKRIDTDYFGEGCEGSGED